MKGRNFLCALGLGMASMMSATSAMAINGALTGSFGGGATGGVATAATLLIAADPGPAGCKAGEIYRTRPRGLAHTRTPGKGGVCIPQTCNNTKVDAATGKLTCYN